MVTNRFKYFKQTVFAKALIGYPYCLQKYARETNEKETIIKADRDKKRNPNIWHLEDDEIEGSSQLGNESKKFFSLKPSFPKKSSLKIHQVQMEQSSQVYNKC